MVHFRSTRKPFPTDLPLVLLIATMALLWVAGGASRADVMAQVVVRAGCWTILILAILAGPRPSLSGARSVSILLAATIALPIVQLIPLPPSWWQALPGRDILGIPGEVAPWRPWTMTPGATRNALASLVVPVTMLLVLAQANERTHRLMPTILLVMIAAAVLLGLLQFSGAGVNNPLLNDTPGVTSSVFANRNHFALLVAIGCVVAPSWAVMDRAALRWRVPLTGGLVLLFVLTILATGSRSGMLLAGLSLLMSVPLSGQRLRRSLTGTPAWLLPTLLGAAALVAIGFVALSFAADRADAINRLITLQAGEDMRSRALPTVTAMISDHMPFGSGFGSFDPLFRIYEPFGLLKLSYFNQAHNDYLGIALDGGIVGLSVLAAAILWWLVETVRAWRSKTSEHVYLGRLGSAIIFLILVASLTDYPVRTPTIMAILVIAAIWLGRANAQVPRAALPAGSANL